MIVQASDCHPGQLYYLMVQTILPRPVAWVLTQNRNRAMNLAPFSYFNGVTSEPPVLSISVGKKKDLSKKDTWINIEERDYFVVHIPCTTQAGEVDLSANPLEYGDSEILQQNLKTCPVEGWLLPRLEGSRAALFCRKYAIHEVGTKPQALILGEILSFWLDPEMVRVEDSHYFIDAGKLDPLARLGHDTYAGMRPLT